MRYAIAALFIAALPSYSEASCPKVFVRKQAVALVQYVPVYPQQYQVGAQVQQEAIIEAAIAKALSRFQATTVTERTITTTQASVGGQASVQGMSAGNWTGKLTKCNGCHGATSANAKAIEHWAITAEMTCEERLAGIRAMQQGHMPKNGTLTPQEAGDHIGALSGVDDLVRPSNVPPPPPEPAQP